MSTDIFDDLDALRRRAREDRHAFAGPLFLFGTLILLAPLCYWPAPQPEGDGFYWDKGLFPQFTSSGMTRYPDLVGWYWVLTIVGGLWLTSWWYRHRAQQQGVETDTRLVRIVAVAVLLGFLIWQPLFDALLDAVSWHDVRDESPRIMMPLLFGGAMIAAGVGQWGARRTGSARLAALGVAAFFATLAFGALSLYLHRGHAALLIVAVTLLVLAWAERSVLLAVVSAGFAGVALVTNLYNVANVYARLGWVPGQNVQTLATQNLLLPGVILLAGGAAAMIGQRR
jgi:hypothetical protein